MADNQLVSNSWSSTNPDIRPRAIEKTSGGNQCLTQVVAPDWGGSGAEQLSFATALAAAMAAITVSVTPSIATSIGSGSKNVTTAGTRVQLATTTTCKKVIITANVANTGTIWVGGSSVAANSGIPLVALQNVTLDISDLAAIWLDSTVNGEGVTYAYLA